MLCLILSYRFPPASTSTPTWLDNVRCTGRENRLASCRHNGYGNEDCSHIEDVGLVCRPSTRKFIGIDETYCRNKMVLQ